MANPDILNDPTIHAPLDQFDQATAMFRDALSKKKPAPEKKTEPPTDKEPPKEDKKKEETPKPQVPAEDKKSEEKLEDKEKPEVVKPAKRPKKELSPEELVSLTAEKVGNQIASRMPEVARAKSTEPATPQAEAIPANLPEEITYKIDVLEELERISPKHQGKRTEYIKFISKLDGYQKKWESEHDGEEFDPDAPEHDSFYSKNEPRISDRDLDRAKSSLATKDVRSKEVDELKGEVAQLKGSVAERELSEKVITESRTAMGQILAAFDEKYADAVQSEAGVKKLEEDDPVAFAAAATAAQSAIPFISEVVKLYDSNGAIKFSDKNQVHRNILDFAHAVEKAVSAWSMPDRMRDGKLFVTMAEYARNPDQDKFWTVDRNTLIEFRVAAASEAAKKMADEDRKRYESWAKKKGYSQPKPAEEEKPKPPSDTPPPAGAARLPADTSSNNQPVKPQDFRSLFEQRLRGQ